MKLIRTAQALFLFDVLIWIAFGAYGMIWLSQTTTGQGSALLFLEILVFGNAGALLLSAVLLGKGRKLFYYAALAVLIVNIAGTLMDQLGIYDYAFLGFELVMLAVLISIRKHYS